MRRTRAERLAAELTRIRRVAKVVDAFNNGDGMTARQVAELTGLTKRSAQRMLNAMALVIPIYRDDGGVWQRCEKREMLG